MFTNDFVVVHGEIDDINSPLVTFPEAQPRARNNHPGRSFQSPRTKRLHMTKEKPITKSINTTKYKAEKSPKAPDPTTSYVSRLSPDLGLNFCSPIHSEANILSYTNTTNSSNYTYIPSK